MPRRGRLAAVLIAALAVPFAAIAAAVPAHAAVVFVVVGELAYQYDDAAGPADRIASVAYRAGSNPNVVIPASVDLPVSGGGTAAYTVTSLNSGSLSQPSITSVDLPSTITAIGQGAFSGSGITSIVIPDSVTSIPGAAFYSTPLASITLGSGIQSIGHAAFSRTQLTSISIPDSVISIANEAFVFTPTLTSIDLGSGVQTIGVTAFYGTSLTSLVIPDSTISIGHSAFAGVPIETLTLGSSVQSIAPWAFGMARITAVTLPDSLTSLGSAAFAYNDTIASLTLGSGLPTITEFAFSGNALTALEFPPVVTEIELAGFSSNAFTSLTIPGTLATIGEEAFNQNGWGAYLTSLTLGEGVQSIGNNAFSTSLLTELTIPSTVTAIGSGAFAYAPQLTDVFMTGPAPTTFFDANSATGSFGGAAGKFVHVPPQYSEPTVPGGYVIPQWRGYTTGDLGPGDVPRIDTTSLPAATQHTAYDQQIVATGRPDPTFRITWGALPPGLTLSSDGRVTGTPTSSGRFTFRVTAMNAEGMDSREYTLTVDAGAVVPGAPPAVTTLPMTGSEGSDLPALAALLLGVGVALVLAHRWREASRGRSTS